MCYNGVLKGEKIKKPLDIERVVPERSVGHSQSNLVKRNDEAMILGREVNRLTSPAQKSRSLLDRMVPYLFAVGLSLLTAYLVITYSNSKSTQSTGTAKTEDLSNSNPTATTTDKSTALNFQSTESSQSSQKSATPAATASSTTAPAKDSFNLRVLNGSGVAGKAAEAKTKLETAGFKVSSVGNAQSFTYSTSVIYYLKDKKAEADLVGKELSNLKSTAEEASQQFIGNDDDILVVVGKE